jgi:hypothetical protein
MAVKGQTKDAFANIAYLMVQESASATLTFAQLALAGQLIGQKYAIIVHRVETRLHMAMSDFAGTADKVRYALTVSDRITDITDLSQPEILFYGDFQRYDTGTAASSHFIHMPFIRDFMQLPGGGLLVPADRMYAGVLSTSLAIAAQISMRVYYSVKELAVDEYWELIEARRVMST